MLMVTYVTKKKDLNFNLKSNMFAIKQKSMVGLKLIDIEEILINIQLKKIVHSNLFIKQNMLVQDVNLSR